MQCLCVCQPQLIYNEDVGTSLPSGRTFSMPVAVEVSLRGDTECTLWEKRKVPTYSFNSGRQVSGVHARCCRTKPARRH